ncbi:hypothetical protein BGX38DRAFT_1280601 [Terfezia claveryi]|nr:hypothetical protein BGX38DRAFT_1280601 [Terfezia claveryi]
MRIAIEKRWSPILAGRLSRRLRTTWRRHGRRRDGIAPTGSSAFDVVVKTADDVAVGGFIEVLSYLLVIWHPFVACAGPPGVWRADGRGLALPGKDGPPAAAAATATAAATEPAEGGGG